MTDCQTLERPLSKGAQTRERILDIAEMNVLQKGFAATSLDEIIFEAGLTKSGFFYHFSDKTHLARALMERFLERDAALLDAIWSQAESLSEDPLHAFLICLKLFADALDDLPAIHPGCMVAAVAYHEQQFDRGVRALAEEAALAWRRRFRRQLDRIVAFYPAPADVNLDDLADMLMVTIEGAIVLSKTMAQAPLLARQVRLTRTLIRTAFLGR
ncbi:MAG: TetR/AcrR family transcriptional regulator [Caulobacter sp.]|nr:TetR/AcrR family transcriptional regulator [Caulobacter sp.]